jgi:hypothetical protein
VGALQLLRAERNRCFVHPLLELIGWFGLEGRYGGQATQTVTGRSRCHYEGISHQAVDTQVDFVVVRGADIGTVNVKRLNKRPIPPKFGRKLSEKQKEAASHICIDCGWIYYLPTVRTHLTVLWGCSGRTGFGMPRRSPI